MDRNYEKMKRVIQAGAISVALISLIAMLGYHYRHLGMTSWVGDTRMAIPTAVSLFILAVCLWLSTSENK